MRILYLGLSGVFSQLEWWERRLASPDQLREAILPSATANTYIAITHMILMATALGLGTCWLAGFNSSELIKLFGLPDNLVPVAVIPVGYPAGNIPPPRPRLPFDDILVKT